MLQKAIRIQNCGRLLLGLICLTAMVSTNLVYAADNGVPNLLPFQGRVTDSSGLPINIPVNVKFRVYPPSGSCYVYEETQTVTPTTYGIFSVLLGTAANSTGPANNFARVFNNDVSGTVTDFCPATNSAGGGYAPVTSDWRRLEIVVTDPSGTVIPLSGALTLAQQTIGASAFAISAQMLSGKVASDFIQVNSAISITQSNLATLVGGNDASLLHHHDSLYAKRDGSNNFSGNISTTQDIYAPTAGGQIGIGTGSAAADLHIVKSAPNIRLEATSGGAGNLSLDFYSGATQRGSVRVSESSNGLKFYAGTQEAMAIDSTKAVTFQGSIKTLGTVGVGQYTDAQEPALVTALSGLGLAASGTLWTNSTTNTIKFWNGSGTQTLATSNQSFTGDVTGVPGAMTVARLRGVNIDFSTAPTTGQILLYNGTSWVPAPTPAAGLTNLNGLTVATQTFAFGSSGLTPNIISTTSTHTLNFPMASAVSVTAGVISKADYDNFSSKQSALGFTPVNKAGDTMTGVLTLASDPTANLGASTKQYVDSAISSSGSNFIRRDGTSALTANWGVGGYKLTNLGTPTASTDAASKGYVDTGLATKQDTLSYTPLNAAGGAMTGALTLASDPVVNLGAATKQYVDSQLTGASNDYVQRDGTTTLTANWDIGAWRLTNIGAPSSGGDAANKTYVDNSVSSSAANYLRKDGTVSLAGNWNAGGFNFSNLGNISVAAQKNLTFGGYNNAQESSLTLSLGTGDAGKIWYNSQSNTLKYWDGTTTNGLGVAGSGLGSLNGLSGNVQTLSVNTSVGTAPIWNSASSNHELRIPMANTASVTAGLISKTEYDTFNAKQASLGYTPLNKAGDTMTGVLTLAGDPTAALGAATKQYVDNLSLSAGASYVRRDGSVTLTANWNVGAWKLTNLGTPTSASDAATKAYVDAATPAAISSLGGITLAVQTLATDTTTGTAPVWNSAGSTHTLRIPMANTAAVTAGLISKTEYDAFNGKQASLGYSPLNKAGDTMTGVLTLAGDPTAALGAATKQYVDNNSGTGKLPLTGGTMTGALTLAGDPTANLGAATKQYVDNLSSTAGANYVRRDGSVTLTANWNVGAWKITNLGTPTAGTDAATKAYVDSVTPAAISSLGGITNAVQTLATDTTTGTAPIWNSSGSAHTLRIPMANTASVTAGLISKTEYDTFNGKQSALGYTPLNKAGDTMTGVLTLAGDPTANLGAATKQYVDTAITGGGANYVARNGSTTLSANWDIGAWKLTNLGTPTAATDAATKGYVDSFGAGKLSLSGGTMTGVLTLAGDPTSGLGAATKQYVDTTVTGAGSSYVARNGSTTLSANWDIGAWKLTNLGTPTSSTDAATKGYVDSSGSGKLSLSGGIMTGALTLAGDPTANLGAATKQYVDNLSSTAGANYVRRDGTVTLTANWDLGAWKLTNLGTPTASGDAATKSYVDTFGAGKLSLSGGTMTGALTLAADPTASLGAATKQYVDNFIRRDGSVTLTGNWNAGALSITAGAYNGAAFFYTSDRRLKKNIETVDGLALIQKLRGVTFQWRKDSSDDIGLIAQEVEAVAPALVTTNAETGYKAVKYGNLVGPLIEASKATYGLCVDANTKADRAVAAVHQVSEDVEVLNGEVQKLRDENHQLRRELEEIKSMIKNRMK